MKGVKKILALALALVLVFSLTGCTAFEAKMAKAAAKMKKVDNLRADITFYLDADMLVLGQSLGDIELGVDGIELDVHLMADGNLEKFWEIFDERMELCHRALQCRHERLTGTLSDAAPILWQHGALLRLKKGEKIDALINSHGFSKL